MLTPDQAVQTYILAKDGNRPFLMREAFTADAELETVVKTDVISFPSTAQGLSTLEEVLVRRFCVDYENIFTFCLSKPSVADRSRFQCHWLVGMSVKTTGHLRVGCGRYDWRFDASGKIRKLAIMIDVMKVLPASELEATMRWLSALPHPWCRPEDAAGAIPAHADLADIVAYLKQAGPIPATP